MGRAIGEQSVLGERHFRASSETPHDCEENAVRTHVTEGVGKAKPSLHQLSAAHCYALIWGTPCEALSAECLPLGGATC